MPRRAPDQGGTGGPPGFGLPKQARLLKRPQFLALTDRRRRPDLIVKTGSFLVLGRLNGLSFCRLGLTATKKTGSAVARNRIKRRAREFFRLNRGRWPAALDLLFIARPEAGLKNAAGLNADLARIDGRLASFAPPPAETAAPPGPAAGSRPPAAISRLLSVPVLWAIGLYRRLISPALPPACRFWPTCSQYAAQAITRHGLGRGGLLALKRIFKCHPWHPGGYDPVPPVPEA